MSYEYISIGKDEKAVKEIATFLRLVFPKAKKYSDAFIEWQYLKNQHLQIHYLPAAVYKLNQGLTLYPCLKYW